MSYPPHPYPSATPPYWSSSHMPKFADFMRYLSAKGVTIQCNACGNQNWNVNLSDYGGPVFQLQSQPQWPATAPQYIPFVSMECTNCGYLRFFSVSKFSEWLVLNPPSAI